MNARAENVPISKNILHATAGEGRRVLPGPRQHTFLEMASGVADRSLTATAHEAETSKVLSDYPEIPRPSKWDEFVSDLKLIGVALIIVFLIWAVEYFKDS